jgi:hypothetical protein
MLVPEGEIRNLLDSHRIFGFVGRRQPSHGSVSADASDTGDSAEEPGQGVEMARWMDPTSNVVDSKRHESESHGIAHAVQGQRSVCGRDRSAVLEAGE